MAGPQYNPVCINPCIPLQWKQYGGVPVTLKRITDPETPNKTLVYSSHMLSTGKYNLFRSLVLNKVLEHEQDDLFQHKRAK